MLAPLFLKSAPNSTASALFLLHSLQGKERAWCFEYYHSIFDTVADRNYLVHT
jgi:hypothetical protein